MTSQSPDIEVFRVLHKLSGVDSYTLLSRTKRAREQFEVRDRRALSLFECLGEDELRNRLSANQFAYTEEKPVQESVFIYFDLSTSVDLIGYVAHLRSVIDECIGPHNCRFSDLRLQHSTAFIDSLRNDLGVNRELMETVRDQYEPIIKHFLPFNLTIAGPHILETGGVVLEGVVHSAQFYELRDAASQKTSHVPRGAQRGIHEIVHSTIGYITKGTARQLSALYRRFESMRVQPPRIPIRIRDGRIIATRNKRLVGQPIVMPFLGARSSNLSEEDICYLLREVRNLAPEWRDDEIRNLVWEEALCWIETSPSMGVERLARGIVEKCSGGRLAGL